MYLIWPRKKKKEIVPKGTPGCTYARKTETNSDSAENYADMVRQIIGAFRHENEKKKNDYYAQ